MRHGIWSAGVAAIGVLTVGSLVVRLLLGEGALPPSRVVATTEPSPPRDAASAERARSLLGLRVSNVTGPVERRVRGADVWRTVQTGETIALDESLRTGSGGAALLELQDSTTIWLWPESEVSAERLDNEIARLGIAGGRLDLNVPSRPERSLEVAASSGATAITSGARFSIVVDGAHVATVATREGEVDLVSGSTRVRVPPGMQTRARPGQSPEPIAAIPTELLLAVDWPTTVLRSRNATVRGRAPAGVLVSVAGARVVVAPDGTFAQAVELNEGNNTVQVVAEDVVGRRVVRQSPPLRVDTRPPAIQTRGRWE